MLFLETAYDPATGNTIRLEAVPHASRAPDVTAVDDLGEHRRSVARKRLISDVTDCPDLLATAREPQTSPLMDIYEAMAEQAPRRRVGTTTDARRRRECRCCPTTTPTIPRPRDCCG